MTPSAESGPAQLAVLIGAPHDGDVSMHNDLQAMYNALCRRGLAPQELLVLEGRLDRRLLLGFLTAISRRIARLAHGELLLYVSGHGFFSGETVEQARVGVEMSSTEGQTSNRVYWDEILAALSVPPTVMLTILPDH